MSFFIAASIYILFIIGMSFFLSKKETREDFLIGSRGLSAVPLAISLSTTWISGGGIIFVLYLIINDFPTLLFFW